MKKEKERHELTPMEFREFLMGGLDGEIVYREGPLEEEEHKVKRKYVPGEGFWVQLPPEFLYLMHQGWVDVVKY